jgi:hypothetical protein
MKRILVFPCGSEIGLEIYRSVCSSPDFHLIGGSSVDDHGRFVFEDYVGNLPHISERSFIAALSRIVAQHEIDAIYPAMDLVASIIKNGEEQLGCQVVGSSKEVVDICASKKLMYTFLDGCIPVPVWSVDSDAIANYPVFIKPIQGYGSRNTYLAKSQLAAENFIKNSEGEGYLFVENLPGDEFTIDCFSDRHGQLLFSGARKRSRISGGISTNTKMADVFASLFDSYARAINVKLQPRGAWFFQMKQDAFGNPKLLEVAARLAGSSSLFRSQGVNFALLSLYDAFDHDLTIVRNTYATELDRALHNRFIIGIEYSTVYIGLGDCLIADSGVNPGLLAFVFLCINKGKSVVLIEKTSGNDLDVILTKYRLRDVFDKVIVLPPTDAKGSKFRYIKPEGAIFIDGSFTERLNVSQNHRIPVFSPDMVDVLF